MIPSMRVAHGTYRPQGTPARQAGDRLRLLEVLFGILGLLVAGRLVQMQVWEGKSYRLLALDQQELQEKLIPERGQILVRDRADGTLHPLATNRDAWTVYAAPREMDHPGDVARLLAPLLPESTSSSTTEASLVERWTANPDDPYELVAKNLTTEQANVIKDAGLSGIGLIKGWARFYPEQGVGGHVIGFVRPGDDGSGIGSYGIEGALNDKLSGRPGFINGVKDAGGRRLPSGDAVIRDAVNGTDVVLTIDRTIQHEACAQLTAAVKRHRADGGSVVIVEPQTGAVLAMCSIPDFNPSEYGSTDDLSAFNNPATFAQYEPGSVFKAFTMAIGLDRDKITPKTTYVDAGFEEIDDYKIKNSDGVAHGVQSMTQVLDESLNTGTIFVERLVGRETFREGVERFGFGKQTEVGLTPEATGDVSSLAKKGEIFAATASFGQGISVTPIQLVAAYAALGNGGTFMRPYVVDELIHPDGTREKTKPQVVRQSISARAARLVTGMLVSAVEQGHGKRAGVPGYYVAGKTGTAQIPNPDGPGYLKEATIGGFAGYAPAGNPRFAMMVKIDHPRDVQWAESSAAPLWGGIASFLLSYLDVPMERDPAASPVPTLPVPAATTSTAVEGNP